MILTEYGPGDGSGGVYLHSSVTVGLPAAVPHLFWSRQERTVNPVRLHADQLEHFQAGEQEVAVGGAVAGNVVMTVDEDGIAGLGVLEIVLDGVCKSCTGAVLLVSRHPLSRMQAASARTRVGWKNPGI